MIRRVLAVIIAVGIILGGVIIFNLVKGCGPGSIGMNSSASGLLNQAKALSAKGDSTAAVALHGLRALRRHDVLLPGPLHLRPSLAQRQSQR